MRHLVYLDAVLTGSSDTRGAVSVHRTYIKAAAEKPGAPSWDTPDQGDVFRTALTGVVQDPRLGWLAPTAVKMPDQLAVLSSLAKADPVGFVAAMEINGNQRSSDGGA